MSLEIKRHLGEETVLNGVGWIKPLTLKITNVYDDIITLEFDDNDTVIIDKKLDVKPKLTVKNNRKLIRTPIEQVVFLRCGRELKDIMIELSKQKTSIIDAAKELNIHPATFREYCRRYEIKFIKLPPGWVRQAKDNKGFTFKKKRIL